MARLFAVLYSRRRGPTESSAGCREKDKVFAEMGHNLDSAPETHDPLLRSSTADLPIAPSDPQTNAASAPAAAPRQAAKTSIEMAVERRRDAQPTPPSNVLRSGRRPASRPAPQSTGETDAELDSQPAARAAEVAEPVEEHRDRVAGAPARDPAAIAEPCGRLVESGTDESGSEVVQAPTPVRVSSSTRRPLRPRILAAFVVVLIVGTTIGYMSGKGVEPAAPAARIQTSDSGLKLRLDRDLRGH